MILAEAGSVVASPSAAIIVAVISALAAIGAAYMARRRPRSTVWTAAEEIRREQRQEIQALRSRVDELEAEVAKCQETIETLRRRLQRSGEAMRHD